MHQLKITLKWSKPGIWRRLLVREDTKLDLLHEIIQRAMPWTNSHLHHFIAGNNYYGKPDPAFADMGNEMLNEKRYTVADLAPTAKKKFIYEYDFGDSWQHEVLVEKVLPPDPAFKHPVCVAGANACPPEDCGGIPGYYNLLEALANPKHPDHSHFQELIGDQWDPMRFDLKEINAFLKPLERLQR